MAPIRGVLFDYGLVLSGPPDTAAWSQLRTLFAASEEAFHAAYWRSRHDYDAGTLDASAYWAAVAAELGHPLTPELLASVMPLDISLWTQPNPEMIDWARTLQAHGMRTGVLSNLGDAMEAGLRERCSWLSGFDHLTFSHRLRTAKPDPAIYRHAAEGMALPPAEILFVDDREDNIAAARTFGMQAIRYIDHLEFLQELQTLALLNFPLPAARTSGTGT